MRRDPYMHMFVVLLVVSSCADTESPFVDPSPKGIDTWWDSGAEVAGSDDVRDTVDPSDGEQASDEAQSEDDDSGADGTASETGATDDLGGSDGSDGTDGGPVGELRVGTWNLHNFSKYGTKEFRLEDIADKIDELALDVLAVQELKVVDGSQGMGEQAWDGLLEALPAYEGLHAPYSANDSVVGLLWNSSNTQVLDWQVLFEEDWWEFPRAPVEVLLKSKGVTFTVVVLHLKAFKDSVDRRRAACKMLVEHIADQTDKRYLIIGDMNDDPYDTAEQNSFVGTFLDAEPAYHFLTAELSPESVTSTGYYHYVDGTKITGEFLDHAILTGELNDSFSNIQPEILGLPESEYSDWKKTYSDHFPVVVTLTP